MAVQGAVDVVMPQMGVSVTEGTISRWLKQVGDTIEADEAIVEISTDKVDTEVPSPGSGTITEILVPEGETVDVGTRLAVIDPGGAAGAVDEPVRPADAPADAEPDAASDEPAVAGGGPEPVEPVGDGPEGAAPAEASQAGTGPADGAGSNGAADADASRAGFVSPVVARMLSEHGLELASIPGTGRGGRVTKKDVESHLQMGASDVEPGAAVVPASAPPASPVSPGAPAVAPYAPGELEEVMRFSGLRKAISHHMRTQLDTAAQVTSVFEVDMTRVVAIRKQVNPQMGEQHKVKLSFLPFIMRATIEAIAAYPNVNAEMRGMEEAVIKRYVNMGMAVAVDDGRALYVPVIQRADEKNLVGLQRSIGELAGKAREKKLTQEEMEGATFSITNVGSIGTMIGSPIIPAGTVAILATGTMVKRPMVLTDADGADSIAIRQMMYLSLSYDHRLVDGAYSGLFMSRVKRNLETWGAGEYGA